MIYEEIIKRIYDNTPFAFSRWGDGEWYALNKHSGRNTDGHVYYNDLGDALLKIVKDKQDYFMGVQKAMKISINHSKKYDQDWVNADVFHLKSMSGDLGPFIESLKESHVVYIGNKYHKNLEFVNEFVEVPVTNCWLQRNRILNDVIETFNDRYKVYCFSAGMPANVFVHELWNKNSTNAYIDVGSVFDPYVGRQTRTYHKNIKI